MRIVVTRERDGATFEVAEAFAAPYVLHPDTVIPATAELDVTGYERGGADGGYNTASRFQRLPFDLILTVAEHWSSPRGLFELIAQARAFFAPHQDDLACNLFSVAFYSCDKVRSSFMLRHGAVSVAFGARTERNEQAATAQVSFLFGDPFLYWTGEGGVGVTSFTIRPSQPGNETYGRLWAPDTLAVWQAGNLKTWVLPTGGVPGEPVTVNVLSQITVAAEIVAYGRLVDPTFYNTTNGSTFEYTGVVLAGSTLSVDSIGNVLLDGSPAPGTWSGGLTAQNGSNTFVFNAGTGSNGSAQVTIRGAL